MAARLRRVEERRRTLLVGLAAAGYAAVVGATVLQMYAERPLSEIGIVTGTVAGLGVLALATAYLAALLALYRSRRSALRFLSVAEGASA